MRIEYRDGLLFTTIKISYKGKAKQIDNIVIDTGASHTLLTQDCVDEIGIRISGEDEIVTSHGIGGKEYSFIKKMDKVEIGEYSISDCLVDFTSYIYEDINGLLGLDILLDAGFTIDLKRLDMYLQS
ncbi:MAG: retropepsin-like aspartic protease [Clostridiaceae bacterium]|jgi:predicted aspartyl protease|nr:retropepsin-like aspartic protease [Clostridiaceae bacterium]